MNISGISFTALNLRKANQSVKFGDYHDEDHDNRDKESPQHYVEIDGRLVTKDSQEYKEQRGKEVRESEERGLRFGVD